jgi:molybdate transport system regulatory protein
MRDENHAEVNTMEITCRFCLVKDGKVVIDESMYELLRTIDDLKSLHAASRRLNLSYRSVWDKLKVSEERLGIELVKRHGHRGMSLTPEAKIILNKFDAFRCDAASSLTWANLKTAMKRAMTTKEKFLKQYKQRTLKKDDTAGAGCWGFF